MGSIQKRSCARGQECYHVRELGLDKPVLLRASYEGDICEKCRTEANANIPSVLRAPAGWYQDTGGEWVIETRLDSQVRSLKREMTLELHVRRGEFWEEVAALRRRWSVEPLDQPPPQDLWHPLMPPEMPDTPPPWTQREENTRWWDTLDRWNRDLEVAGRLRIPPALIGDKWRPDWASFISVCVWFRPTVTGERSEPKLLEYAEAGGPRAESLPLLPDDDLELKPLMAMKPPIRFVRNPTEETRIERRYWYEVLLKAWETHIKPQGIGFDEMLAEIERTHPELEQRRLEDLHENRKSGTAWILMHESIRKDDLDLYFSMVTERHGRRPKRGRDKRDRLTCVECAVLHRQHGWGTEELAKRYGWASPHAAENYIKDGRGILNGS